MAQQGYEGNGQDKEMYIVQDLPTPKVPPPVDYSYMITIITAWTNILNARLLALLALTGSLVGFGFVMYDPTTARLAGLAIYAVLCLWPTIALFLRKG